MEESQAFFLLRHLMFRRGMRYQYLPDMVSLQIKLYQLSRLIHDQLPDLYEHFNHYEVAPTLYAAPWLLTVFASQFPLGFVTRVFGKFYFGCLLGIVIGLGSSGVNLNTRLSQIKTLFIHTRKVHNTQIT